MRKVIVAVSCLLVFCSRMAFGQRSGFSGANWKNLSLSERAVYVKGFNAGYVAGMDKGVKKTLEVIGAVKPPSSWTPEERRKLAERAEQIDQKSGHSDFTIGQLEATVTAFYDDYRNMPVCWDDAVRFSTLSLQGNAPTEEELNTARKKGAESGCK